MATQVIAWAQQARSWSYKAQEALKSVVKFLAPRACRPVCSDQLPLPLAVRVCAHQLVIAANANVQLISSLSLLITYTVIFPLLMFCFHETFMTQRDTILAIPCCCIIDRVAGRQ